MGLARRIAARYRRPSEPFDDILQVAALGLVKAVDRFDPSRGVAFSSFEVLTLAGDVKRHYRDHTGMVRPPAGFTAQRSRRAARATVRPGAAALRRGIVRPHRLDAEVVLEAFRRASARSTSASAPVGDDDEQRYSVTCSATRTTGLVRAEDRVTLTTLLHRLSPRVRIALRLRYEEDMTQSQSARSSASRRCRCRGSSRARSTVCGPPPTTQDR